MLTADDLTILRKPFAPEEHEFLRNFVYITEEAITTRLEDVDPSWSLQILSQTVRDNQCVVTVRLTLKDVSRDGVGMQALTYVDKQGQIKDSPEPEKSAATDALKRAARLFGVGRYLLNAPDYVKDTSGVAKWLNNGAAEPAPQVVPPPASKSDAYANLHTLLADMKLKAASIAKRETPGTIHIVLNRKVKDEVNFANWLVQTFGKDNVLAVGADWCDLVWPEKAA